MTTLLKHKTAISVFTTKLCASWPTACGGGRNMSCVGTGNAPATTSTSGTTNTTPPVTIKSGSNRAVNWPDCSFPVHSQVRAITYANDRAASAFIQALNSMRTQARIDPMTGRLYRH
ncbi:hypothetical protein ACO0LB_16935 [Undibacterium sp. SXout7W]|uniref:hypothetical protein n=1 Tax=Undibacterium sp. SXout7W TaxID=3413049 RepID=UPI003BEFF129